MNSLLILVTTAALGIEVGWEPLPGGGHEYTIQLEPQLLGILEQGNEEIFSEVPPNIDVRRYRIVVGTGKLPRDAGPLGSATGDPPVAAAEIPPAATAGAPYGPPPTEPAEPSPTAADQFPLSPGESTAATDQPPRDFDRYGTPTAPEVEPAHGAEIPTVPTSPPADAAENLADGPWTIPPTTPAPEPEESPVADAEPAPRSEHAPGKLPSDGAASGPLRQTTFTDEPSAAPSPSDAHDAQKPKLDNVSPENKPWLPLVTSVVVLCCSLGANFYLGWIAWDARTRYRNAVAKLRGAAA